VLLALKEIFGWRCKMDDFAVILSVSSEFSGFRLASASNSWVHHFFAPPIAPTRGAAEGRERGTCRTRQPAQPVLVGC
jgi:hypothetical protein